MELGSGGVGEDGWVHQSQRVGDEAQGVEVRLPLCVRGLFRLEEVAVLVDLGEQRGGQRG